jgi:predicted GIY-YIG superfamily endonuclease
VLGLEPIKVLELTTMAQTPWFVYMLRCSDASLYTGITNDLEARVKKHNAGKGAKYTKTRRPVKLVFSKKCRNQVAAMKEELSIKRMPKNRKESLAATKNICCE